MYHDRPPRLLRDCARRAELVPALAIRAFLLTVILATSTSCATTPASRLPGRTPVILFDSARQRQVPVEIDMPQRATHCTRAKPCPVALISPGYGIDHRNYRFISSALAELGYLAVAVQHELPTDPPLASGGDLFSARTPNWRRGAVNLRFVRDALGPSYPNFNWDHPMLVGHSNGGDISAWLTRESPRFASSLITLDSRRVPLPRGASPRVLSIRASDFQADTGVLPTAEERRTSGACVVRIDGARHNEMHDGGSSELKATIVGYIVEFLHGRRCEARD